MSTQPTQTNQASSGLKVRQGVLIRTDPVLKVYIEHTLNLERQGLVDYDHLHRSHDLSLNEEHIFLTNQTKPINAEMIEHGLKDIVNQWMKGNSFAQLDDEQSEDEK